MSRCRGITHLGYPDHFVTLLGSGWAYAGMIFDLTTAADGHAVVGDDVRHILTPQVLALLVLASWALRPEGRKLKQASRD